MPDDPQPLTLADARNYIARIRDADPVRAELIQEAITAAVGQGRSDTDDLPGATMTGGIVTLPGDDGEPSP